MRKRILTEDDYSNLTTTQALEEYKFEQSNLIDRVQKDYKDLINNQNMFLESLSTQSSQLYTELSNHIQKNYVLKNDFNVMKETKANKSDLPDLTPYATNQEVEDLYNGLKTEIEELKKLIK